MRMKQLFASMLIGSAAILTSTATLAADMTGAGATFPYPIYAKWAEMYKKNTGNGLNYQSVGSGAGIKQIKAKTVDFGASDMPLSAAELDADGLMQFPAIMGGVVTVRQSGRYRSRRHEADRPGLSPTSTWARSPSGTIQRSPL